MFSISIPSPCHENWDNMSPREQGSFCAVCAKTVVDFTPLSDEEVKNYFLRHQGQKTCGRFRNDQLAEPGTLHELLSRPIPFWKKFLAITLILFGSFLSGCQNAKEEKLMTMGLPVPEYENITTATDKTVADTIFKEDKCTMTVGEIIEPPIIETDGIMPLPIVDEPIPNPDTAMTAMIFVGQIKIDTVKKISVPSPKTDSVTKISSQNSCDTLSTKPIEP